MTGQTMETVIQQNQETVTKQKNPLIDFADLEEQEGPIFSFS